MELELFEVGEKLQHQPLVNTIGLHQKLLFEVFEVLNNTKLAIYIIFVQISNTQTCRGSKTVIFGPQSSKLGGKQN